MKKILFGIGLVLSGLGVQAQELFRPLSAGPKIGANMANIMHDDQKTSKSVYGANAGIVAHYQITKKHAVQTELLYSGKGFVNPSTNVKIAMNYAEVPVLYQHSFFKSKKGGAVAERSRKGNVFFIAGPQLSVLLTSTAKLQKTELVAEGAGESTDMYALTRPFDISAVAGIGYRFKNGLSFDTRYALGLRHIHGSQTALIPTNSSNTAVQAGVSYLIPLNFR